MASGVCTSRVRRYCGAEPGTDAQVTWGYLRRRACCATSGAEAPQYSQFQPSKETRIEPWRRARSVSHRNIFSASFHPAALMRRSSRKRGHVLKSAYINAFSRQFMSRKDNLRPTSTGYDNWIRCYSLKIIQPSQCEGALPPSPPVRTTYQTKAVGQMGVCTTTTR